MLFRQKSFISVEYLQRNLLSNRESSI